MAETSIVFKANDQISGSMKSMLGNSQALSKEFEDLQRKVGQLSQKNDAFNKSFAQVSTQALEAKKSLKEAEDAFKKTGNEESRLNFENAKKQYKDLTDAAKSYEEASKDTRKAIRETQDDMRKLGDSSRSGGGLTGSTEGGILSGDGLGGKLASAGILKMTGDAVSNMAGTMLQSAIGQPMADLASSIASGVATGAAAGALVGLPGVGALVGGAAGAVNGGVQMFQKKDDAFKNYVQENTESQLTQRDTDIQTGSAVAAQREQDAVAFNTMLGDGTGTQYLKDLRTMAAKTPLEYSDLTTMSRSLATGFKDDPSRMLSLMTSIGNAGSAVGVDTEGMNTMATGMARMQSSGKATLEYLNLIQERGVDAIGMLADGLGKSKSQIYDMISKGKIDGVNAVKIIQKAMDTMYDGAMEKQSQTFSGLTSTLQDAQTEMQAAYGDGYNTERGKGIKAETDYLTGISGQRQQEANRAIGAWQASLENAKEKAIRDAVNSAMDSDAYSSAQASGDAAKMGELIAQAKVQGQNEYNASKGAQLELESEKALAGAIRDDAASNQDYWDAGYEKGNWYTQGLAAAIFDPGAAGYTYNPITDTWSGVDGSSYDPKTGKHYKSSDASTTTDRGAWNADYIGSKAFGMRRVSQTGLYLLHQDETVKTAAESRAGSGGSGFKVEFTGPINVRQESDLDEIAERLYQKIQLAQLRAGG